jgi:hypothetical protein
VDILMKKTESRFLYLIMYKNKRKQLKTLI